MTLREKIQADIKSALKKGDNDKLSTLRMFWSAIRNEEIDKKESLDDKDVEKVAKKQVKQLKDSLVDFKSGDRADLAAKTEKEIDFLSEYLPKQISSEQIEKIVDEEIEKMKSEDSLSPGPVMGAVMSKIGSSADGSVVREIVMKKIENK
ncbi:MAG: GatB/YqeY domain-containing protein [Candidatus Magasanikbacteria bacterium]|nr:GatB/YqeY domain-containing protein [Candidatus Magasanikbacteria bacterium]